MVVDIKVDDDEGNFCYEELIPHSALFPGVFPALCCLSVFV